MMAPRQEEDDGMILHSAVNDSPLLKVKPFEHSLSIDELELSASVEESILGQEQRMQPQLLEYLKQLAEVGTGLLNDINASFGESRSPTITACKGSLAWEFPAMLAEANVLIECLKTEGLMITSLRIYLAQVRVHSYLQSIHAVLNSVDKTNLDCVLTRVVNPVLTAMGEEKTADLPVRISSWRTPSLAFDIELGTPVNYTHKASPPSNKGDFDYQKPMRLHAKAIADITSKDIEDGTVGCFQPCNVSVERCRHEQKDGTSSLGVEGEALVKIRLSPIGTAKSASEDWDAKDNHVRVQEARVVQTNAFPPEPKTVADIYTSSVHGFNDATVALRFNTYKTRNNEAPEFLVELVVGPSS
mmetsp:Transcript_20121/g.34368  ORF Transcript_20121/g.34368 Transcript_20121/m.34368 type:complete len:358 (-) Transcript_20121:239-1312(-)